MNTSDSDLKVNRNIYPDAVTCDRMRLIGPKCDQLGLISTVYFKELSSKGARMWLAIYHNCRKSSKNRVLYLPMSLTCINERGIASYHSPSAIHFLLDSCFAGDIFCCDTIVY